MCLFNKNKNLHVEDFRVWCTVQVAGSRCGTCTECTQVLVHTCACVYTAYHMTYITRQLYLLNRLLVHLNFIHSYLPVHNITIFFVHYRSTAAVYRVLLFYFLKLKTSFLYFLKKNICVTCDD